MPDSQNVLDFGRYRIQRLLGRGGMGEVYLARDEDLERDVAIKFVSSQKLQDSAARARLLREAQAAAGLDHPGICPVHEAGLTPDGRAYIVMPFVAGTALSDLIAGGGLPVREALQICGHIAEALVAAHQQGIVHRDLKPSNVIVSPNGQPRLLDFGLAQSLMVPKAIAEAQTVTIGPETSDPLVGTPSYMSPEQVQRRPLDGRSDLFSLGAVLYECLTGVRAFDGSSAYDIMNRVLRVEPPPPSTLRRELTDRHDALCARLLAKEPADRFKSADEAVGAFRLLLPDTGRVTDSGRSLAPPPSRRIWSWPVIATLAVLVAVSAGVTWYLMHPGGLPTVPEDSDRWYRRGVESIRDGAYQTGRTMLEQAVAKFPQHALAYARMAEADMELDDQHAAQADLVHLSSIVPEESRLSSDERLRVQAVRALVLRDVDAAVKAYTELVRRNPRDAGALVDLGRAQNAAGLRSDARASFAQALDQDREYAAAYLQLGSVESDSLRVPEALQAFDRAEELYEAASNAEGQTEVLLRRAGVLDASNEVARARADAQRALTLASASKNLSQQVRARLTISSITASEGRSTEAVQSASASVADASAAGLDLVAANGLIDLAGTFMDLDRPADAQGPLVRALEIATERSARRTSARATLQLAALRSTQTRYAEAVGLVDRTLPFLREGHYKRFEILALLIRGRAQRSLGKVKESRDSALGVLDVAEAIKDDGRIALAASEVAAGDTLLGQYPDALSLRERAETIYRRQGDQVSLAYTLLNRAELLLRLGRPADANAPLSEVEAGAAKRIDVYVGLARRAGLLRMFAAATVRRCGDVLSLAARFPADATHPDAATVVGPALAAECDAASYQAARTVTALPPEATQADLIERERWLASAALAHGDAPGAAAAAARGLAALGDLPNDDLRWQLAAASLAANRALGRRDEEARADVMFRESLARLQDSWKGTFTSYESRADLAELKLRAQAPQPRKVLP